MPPRRSRPPRNAPCPRDLPKHGILVDRVIPSTTHPNAHNLSYLETKYKVLGHRGLEKALRSSEQSRVDGQQG